jgi:hypothetical protein
VEPSFSKACERLIEEIKSGKCPLCNCPICKTPQENTKAEFIEKMLKSTILLSQAISELMRKILDGEIVSSDLTPGPKFEVIHKLNSVVDQISKDVRAEVSRIK